MVKGFLHIYHYPLDGNAQTIVGHVHGFRYSKHGMLECNVALGFPPIIKKCRFQGILLHYSLFGSGFDFFRSFDEWWDFVLESDAFKVAYVQDEYQAVPERRMFTNLMRLNILFSLFLGQNIGKVYGDLAPKVRPTLTGYVSETMRSKALQFSRPVKYRTIDVGYRTRRMPIWRGEGGQDKGDLADGWLLRTKGLRNDIMACEEGRLYGDDWWRFLGNCQFVLGTEAGVSLVDVQGEVKAAFDRGELTQEILDRWDNNIFCRVISPRHFEAAAFRCCQILHPGYYNGILKPWFHYIPLEKDWSNLGQVLELMGNESYCDFIRHNAYNDLIKSHRYDYPLMAQEFDAAVPFEGSPAMKPCLRAVSRVIAAQRRAELGYRRLDNYVGDRCERVSRKLRRYSVG